MFKTYAIMFISSESKRPRCDTMCARSAAEARRYFHECYRHGNYTILAVAEMPEQ